MQEVRINEEKYGIYGSCFKLTNGVVEVFVTKDLGPRVICYRFIGDENILSELGPEAVVKSEYGEWHPWGGHRLWHAPEVLPRSYWPDNDPVEAEVIGKDTIRLKPALETGPMIQKEMIVKLAADGTNVTITHKLTSLNTWAVELAPWCLTIMNGGGTAICPQEPFIPHGQRFLPARPMVLWNFTDLSDSRLRLGKKYVTLSTDSNKDYPNKFGMGNAQGWAGYVRKNNAFVKRFPFVEGATYPDMGSNFESYTSGDFIEVETLGPVVKLEPGASVEYVENWFLFDGVNVENTDDSIDAAILPLVSQTA